MTGRSSASVGRKDGEPFDGGTSERMPLIIGEDRLIPGFEANLVGMNPGDTKGFDITFPEDYPEASLAGQDVHFDVDLRELREKIQPEADDAFAQSMGDYADLAALKVEIDERLHRNALDKARHEFADKIIEYAVANATIDLPEVLVDQEVEVMHDEFRTSLARQGISEEAYLKATEKTEEDIHAEFRPRAEHRVKVLLVLSKIAEVEGVEVSDAQVEAQVAEARERYERPEDRSSTSSPSVAATSSAARCGEPGSSRCSSTDGLPPTRSTRRCRTSRMTRRRPSMPPRPKRQRSIDATDPGAIPDAIECLTRAMPEPAGETHHARPDGHRVHQPR